MTKIVRGAIGPALIVAILQCVIELMFLIVTFAQPFRLQLAGAYFLMVPLSQLTLLIGAIAYAGFLTHRSRASLSGCAVAGGTVGLLANFASQAAKCVLVCLAVAVVFGGGAFKVALVVTFLSCLLAGIGGLILGEIGGGAVGLLAQWLQRTRPL